MSVLYTPRGRAREYAPLSANVYSGCSHGCIYCYAPAAVRRKREDFHQNPGTRTKLLHQLELDCKRSPGDGQRVLLSFTTDPYQPLDIEHCVTRFTITILHRYGYNVQILTKGGTRALRDLDLFTTQDAFATTMTLTSAEHSRQWEPGAALPADRIYTIHAFHEAGIPTWVSLEPVLNPVSALTIIRQTHTFVDLFKVGKLNHHPLSRRIDWAEFGNRAINLLESLDQPYYIKDDLAAYLPAEALGPCHITVAELERRTSVRAPLPHIAAPAVQQQPSLFQIQ